MRKPRIGYLPLYVKLYDDSNPHSRDPLVKYMHMLVSMLESEGLEMVVADVCRIKEEFSAAIEQFKAAGVDAVVTQHLAYSPSLESIDALLSLDVPLIVLDTTPTYDLLNRQDYENCISPNHGIHGVQDMCCLLRLHDKSYQVCAGHALHSDVIARTACLCRAAASAKAFSKARVGTVGGSFAGMGDFLISPERYKAQIGAEVIELTKADSIRLLEQISDEDIEREKEFDRQQFHYEIGDVEAYEATIRSGLVLRRWIDEQKLTALTVNFLKVDDVGLTKMPFVELCKTMMRGIGYAGEGDVLTAGMVGALLSVYPDTTFTEMFCPDWEKDVILLSHMGEMNLALSQWTPILADMSFNYNATGNTAAAFGCLKEGSAVLVNLAPQKDNFRMTLAPVDMLPVGRPFGAYRYEMQGWMKPHMPLKDFLPRYSQSGGTHHSALVYNTSVEELRAFGEYLGFETEIID